MRSALVLVVGISLVLGLSSCGGSATPTSLFGPNIAGDWEITAVSTSGDKDLVQVRLTQNDHNASGSNVVFYSEHADGIHSGALCAGTGPDSVAVKVANDGSLQFTLNDGVNTFQGSGHYKNGIMSGTYESTAGSTCPNSATWTAKPASPLKASFSGSPLGAPNIVVKLELTENATDHSVTGSGSLLGDINVDLSFAGSYVGNAITGEATVIIPNQPPIITPVNFYYSSSKKAIYLFEADGTSDGHFNQD